MYEDNQWNAVTGDELQGFIGQVNPIDGKYQANAQTTEVSWRTLPFYDQVVLIRLRDRSWGKQSELSAVVLSWERERLHERSPNRLDIPSLDVGTGSTNELAAHRVVHRDDRQARSHGF